MSWICWLKQNDEERVDQTISLLTKSKFLDFLLREIDITRQGKFAVCELRRAQEMGPQSPAMDQHCRRYDGLGQCTEACEYCTKPIKVSTDCVLQLNEGGDAARSDDTCRLKTHVALWLNESYPSNQPLDPFQKLGRGFRSDATGRLLCPAKYDWDSAE